MNDIKHNADISGESGYKRDLGLLEAVSIVIGRIIGSGIFRTPAPIMALVGTTGLFGLVWAIGGIITILAAVCYAELVAMIPKSGGPYVYLRAAYPPVWAFLRGWAMFFVSETAAVVAVALVFSEHLAALCRVTSGYVFPRALVVLVALAVIWLLTAINFFGVFLSGMVQNILSAVKVAAILGVIAISMAAKGSTSHFTSPLWPDSFSWDTVLAVGAGLRYSFFAFSGWEGATYVAEEVKNPRRNLPLSLFLGIGAVILLYLGSNIAYLYQLAPSAIASSTGVAVDAMQAAIGGAGAILIAWAVMINTFGNVNSQIMCKARTWQAMAHDGLFFKPLATIHSRFHTPNNALVAVALWGSVLLIVSSFADHMYEAVIDFFAATGIIFNIMTFSSVIILRRKYPLVQRPYKAWFYPWSVLGILAFYVVFLTVTLITAPVPSLMGLALTSTGLLYYRRIKRLGRIPSDEPDFGD